MPLAVGNGRNSDPPQAQKDPPEENVDKFDLSHITPRKTPDQDHVGSFSRRISPPPDSHGASAKKVMRTISLTSQKTRSLEPAQSPDAKTGTLSRSEKNELIQDLAERFCKIGRHARYDNHMLERFLKGFKWDINVAYDALLKHLEWRRQNDVDFIYQTFSFDETRAVKKYYQFGFHGTDYRGRPIYIDRIGSARTDSVFKYTTHERLLRFIIQDWEETLEHRLPSCCKASGHHVGTICSIVDLQGFGWNSLNKDIRRMLRDFTCMAQPNYPELLGVLFIVNAPAIFRISWNWIKGLLDPMTQDKIKILGKNYRSVLENYMDCDQLPVSMGGKVESDWPNKDIGPWMARETSVWVPWRAKSKGDDAVSQSESFFTCREYQMDVLSEESDDYIFVEPKSGLAGMCEAPASCLLGCLSGAQACFADFSGHVSIAMEKTGLRRSDSYTNMENVFDRNTSQRRWDERD